METTINNGGWDKSKVMEINVKCNICIPIMTHFKFFVNFGGWLIETKLLKLNYAFPPIPLTKSQIDPVIMRDNT